MRVEPYRSGQATEWDEFVARARTATFLHTRSYLSYSGDRFPDVSLVVLDDGRRWIAVLPAAIDRRDPTVVVSHPGITYGGMLHAGALQGDRMIEAFQHVRECLARRGFERFRYKAVPYIYHRVPSSDDLYALYRVGAARYRCDLSCAIDLENRTRPSERRRRGLKKAGRNGVKVAEGPSVAGALWKVLEANLELRYNLKPVHTVDEILLLHSRFPSNIEFVAAELCTSGVIHSQYAASNVEGREACALDAVFEHCLEKAALRRARYFSFGVSTEDEGRYLNAPLHEFKREFGGGGVVHDFYELALRPGCGGAVRRHTEGPVS
jgi:hypothetical protein